MIEPPTPRRSYRPGGRQTIPRPEGWTALDDPAPAAHPLRVSTDDVARRLEPTWTSQPLEPDFDGARLSAVLVVLADDANGQASVLLTRRSRLMRNHSGEISFPGGRFDPGENAVQAALREAREEVGLSPRLVTVIGELGHLSLAMGGSYIVPIVARVPAAVELFPASIEVERIMWVPLAELVRADTFRAERWGTATGERVLHFFELDDETVWGITAFVLSDLLGRL